MMIVDGDEDEGNDAIQSDKVYLALNVAFMPMHKMREFNFFK